MERKASPPQPIFSSRQKVAAASSSFSPFRDECESKESGVKALATRHREINQEETRLEAFCYELKSEALLSFGLHR